MGLEQGHLLLWHVSISKNGRHSVRIKRLQYDFDSFTRISCSSYVVMLYNTYAMRFLFG